MQLGDTELDRLGVLEVSGTHVVGMQSKIEFFISWDFSSLFLFVSII